MPPRLSPLVVVVGDALLDRYCVVERSEWDSALAAWAFRVTAERCCPGGAANVAINVRRLGAEPLLVSAVGEDEAGSLLLSLMRRRGGDLTHVLVSETFETPQLTRVTGLDGASPLDRIDRSGGWAYNGAAFAADWQTVVRGADAVIVADYGRLILDPPFRSDAGG